MIHQPPRKWQHFTSPTWLNLLSIPLCYSETFRHVKGAFTPTFKSLQMSTSSPSAVSSALLICKISVCGIINEQREHTKEKRAAEIMIQLISRKLLNESLRLRQISHTRNEYKFLPEMLHLITLGCVYSSFCQVEREKTKKICLPQCSPKSSCTILKPKDKMTRHIFSCDNSFAYFHLLRLRW
jgi:hypothetical protein